MVEPILASPRILVIEDYPDHMQQMVSCLGGISPELKRRYGIRAFEITEVGSVSEAKRAMESLLFDLALLDLQLPNEPGDDPHIALGLDLLKFIKASDKVKGVVIVSSFSLYHNVIATIRGGALDFVAKETPFRSGLPTPVLNALARLMAIDSTNKINQRLRDLVPYAEVGLTHSFRRIFKELQKNVTRAADDIERYSRERFGLDVDHNENDPLVVSLRRHREAILSARQDLTRMEADLAQGGNRSEVIAVKTALTDLRQDLLPALVVKKVTFTPPENPAEVQTFEQDVVFVLREIILGTLSELPDYGDDREIQIEVKNPVEGRVPV